MEIGINIFSGVTPEAQVECFKKYGVTRTFLASEDPELERVVKLFQENDILCETLHSPFDRINDMWKEGEEGDRMLARLMDGVDKCAKYGIPVLIVHVSSGRPMPEISESGTKRYASLVEYAVKRGVTIAFENLRYLENLQYIIDLCPGCGFCWDCGHEYCYTPGVENVPILGDKLVAVHLHDNRCRLDADDHVLPFDGKIDMETVAKHLANSGYSGTIMLEITKDACFGEEKLYADWSDEEYIRVAADRARKLAEMVEGYRSMR